MFGLFKRKSKRVVEEGIAATLKSARKRGEDRLSIDLYVDNQVLFQVVPAIHYEKRGIDPADLGGLMEIHFFNNNKTLTIENEERLKESDSIGQFIEYEEPKGNRTYIKAIGMNPDEIERIILKRVQEVYGNVERERISIRYVQY